MFPVPIRVKLYPDTVLFTQLNRLNSENESRRRRGYISVQVQYAGMTSVIDTTSETLKLKSPAALSDLENLLWQLHPALQTLQWFQVLLNGAAAPAGNPGLNEGDVVVFLTRMGGG